MMQQHPIIESSSSSISPIQGIATTKNRISLAALSCRSPWNDQEQHHGHQHSWIRQVAAPVSLLGGTAALYQHVLNDPSSTLTPMSICYMLLLAIHYAIQPRLSKKYIAASTSTTSVALVEELTKASIAVVLLTATTHHKWQPISMSVLTKSTALSFVSSSLLVAGVPAALYALQNVLQYTSHQHLDAVTFNGLSQTKTLSAALWCYLLLGKPQTPLQLVALGILFASAMLFQRDTTKGTKNSKSGGSTATPLAAIKDTATTASRASTATTLRQQRLWLGILPCAVATLLSGLAGALSQKGVQASGSVVARNAYFYAMEVSLYSALTLSASRAIVAALQHKKQQKQSSSLQQSQAFWTGWTYQTWYPVVSKAIGGVLTVLVHKYTGAVSKGFALMFGLVLAGILESAVDKDNKPMPWPHVLGTLLVMLSGWLHLTQQ